MKRRTLPPHVKAKLARRRGTVRQREIAFASQAPIGDVPIQRQRISERLVLTGRHSRIFPGGPADDADDDAYQLEIEFPKSVRHKSRNSE